MIIRGVLVRRCLRSGRQMGSMSSGLVWVFLLVGRLGYVVMVGWMWWTGRAGWSAGLLRRGRWTRRVGR